MEVQNTSNNNTNPTASAVKAAVASEVPASVKATAVETTQAVRQAAPTPTLSELSQAVKNINKAMQDQGQALEFSVDTDSQRTVVKIIDQTTKEVLRQMPSQEAIEISKALGQSSGLLIKQKA